MNSILRSAVSYRSFGRWARVGLLGVTAIAGSWRSAHAQVAGTETPTAAVRTSTPSGLIRDPLFIEASVGPTYLALLAVRGSRSAFPNMVTFTGWGPGAGVTVGFHALIFSVGLNVHWAYLGGSGTTLNPSTEAQVSADGNFHLVTVTGVGAFRLPMGRVEPSLRLGVGYASMSGFASPSAPGLSGSSADGWTVQTGLGIDIRLFRRFFLGFGVDASVANARRSGLGGANCGGSDPFCAELQRDGDAIALTVFPYLSASFHIF